MVCKDCIEMKGHAWNVKSVLIDREEVSVSHGKMEGRIQEKQMEPIRMGKIDDSRIYREFLKKYTVEERIKGVCVVVRAGTFGYFKGIIKK